MPFRRLPIHYRSCETGTLEGGTGLRGTGRYGCCGLHGHVRCVIHTARLLRGHWPWALIHNPGHYTTRLGSQGLRSLAICLFLGRARPRRSPRTPSVVMSPWAAPAQRTDQKSLTKTWTGCMGTGVFRVLLHRPCHKEDLSDLSGVGP